MQKVININPILKRIEHMEKELEELKIELLRSQTEQLPNVKVDEETLRELEKRFKEYQERKAKVVSAEEAKKGFWFFLRKFNACMLFPLVQF